MTKHSLTKVVLSVATGALVLGGPALALAQTDVNVTTSATVRPGMRAEMGATMRGNASTSPERRMGMSSTSPDRRMGISTEDRVKERANMEIERRTSLLDALMARLEGAGKVSADVKANISATLQSQIDALTALKAKIASETDVDAIKADVKSITSSYRTFALVAPQAAITAYASRLTTLMTQMTTLGTKLQTRIDAASSAGTDVSAATSAMSDFNAKVADAKTQIDVAVSEVSGLTPDNGDTSVAASNKTALQDARAKLETARTDLETARKYVETIRKALSKVEAGANTTTEAQAN